MTTNNKGFSLIELMIVVAIIAILAMVAVSQYLLYIERSRTSATFTLLQNLALAQYATQAPPYDTRLGFQNITGSTVTDLNSINALTGFGFRPDPQVGFACLTPVAATSDDFIIFAAYMTPGSKVYIYSNSLKTGVHLFAPASVYGPLLPNRLYMYTWGGETIGSSAVGHIDIDVSTGLVSSVTKY